MPQLQSLLLPASFSPERLALARKSFDEAWAQIAGNYTGKDVVDRARAQLATLVLGVMAEGDRDVGQVRDAALELMRRAEQPIPLRKGPK